MLVREYKNLDKIRWRNSLELYCMFAESAHGDYWFMGKGIWRRVKYANKYYAHVNNFNALDSALMACGEARRYEVEPAVAAARISDMKTWYGIEDDVKEILDSMLADLDQWARDSEAEARAIAEAEAAVVEEPKKKSFFKRFFSK